MAEKQMLPVKLPTKKNMDDLISKKSTEVTAPLIRTTVTQAVVYIDKLYACVAGLLERVYVDGLWKDWGFSDFYQYAEVELKFCKRKAGYLRAMHKSLIVDYKLKPSEIEELTWSKAKEIPGVCSNATEARAAIKKFKNMNMDEIRSEVKSMRTNGKSETFTRRSFTLADSQAKHVDSAFKVAAAMSKSDKPGHLLDMICFEFLSGHNDPKDGFKKTLKDFERVFNIKVVALNEQGKVVYGKKHIEELG